MNKVQNVNFLVSLTSKSSKIFPVVTMPSRKHIVVYLESSFKHSVFFEEVAMTVVKLYPDPSRFEYLTFADFAEVAIICYRPSVHSIFGCPTYYRWSQALSFRARGQSKKKFENS